MAHAPRGVRHGFTVHRRHPSRRAATAVLAVLALIAGRTAIGPPGISAATAGPAPNAGPAPKAEKQAAGRQVVTLVTGDRVAVQRFADGRTAAAVLPGSPNHGEPMRSLSLAGELYAWPANLPRARFERLDLSMVNVTRLAAAEGAVPVEVTFRPGSGRTMSPVWTCGGLGADDGLGTERRGRFVRPGGAGVVARRRRCRAGRTGRQ